MYVFIGASISSRSGRDAELIAERIKRVCQVLDRLGHTYDSDILTSTEVHREASQADFTIPDKYLSQISDALVQSIAALRVKNPPYSLRDEIACHKWSLDLLRQAGACIWDLTVSSTGSGFEIATALDMHKPCLVLFDRPTVSTMLNGCTSRLLTVRRWSEDLEQVVEGFINKAEKGLDRVVRFNVDQEMAEWVKIAAKRNGFENVSQYLRFLIDQDRQTQAE